MKTYSEYSHEELLSEKEKLTKEYEAIKGKNLKLDMSRGKPETGQLDLSMGLMDMLFSKDSLVAEDGVDCRNYGDLDGIKEAKRMMAMVMSIKNPDNVLALGNASLSIMYDMVCRSFTHGVMGHTPWHKLDKVKWLCPVPGYDRHFTITEYFGLEMINIPMSETGPDMDMVEELVNNDPSVKGIWCVPKYSNPQGISYSDDTVRRFANLKPAAEDFRIYWDNAYNVHHLYDEEDKQDQILDILSECEKAGNPDLVFIFGSTSKISMAGSGVAGLAASQANLKDILAHMGKGNICYDKVNQLRHAKYFTDIEKLKEQMRGHASILRPKFEAVEAALDKELTGLGAGSWISPRGGYFITFESFPGCAKEIVKKCKEAGLVLTDAGAPFPYKKDPNDSIIRIAPSFPSVDDLKKATELFITCVKLSTVEKLLG